MRNLMSLEGFLYGRFKLPYRIHKIKGKGCIGTLLVQCMYLLG